MRLFNTIENAEVQNAPGHDGYTLLDEANGCVTGCCAGIIDYFATDYADPGIHTDQEGFYVIAGKGVALLGDQEMKLDPGVSFIVPAGLSHTIHIVQEEA